MSLSPHCYDPRTPTAKSTSNTSDDAAFKEQLKKQKVAAALAKAQVNKLKRQVAAEPEAQSIQNELAAAEQKQQEEDAKLEQLTNTLENR